MSPGLNQGEGKAMDEARLYKETSVCCCKDPGGSKEQRMLWHSTAHRDSETVWTPIFPPLPTSVT